jgi:pyrroloquinoline quinone (PQQ) biosynthesis protein C
MTHMHDLPAEAGWTVTLREYLNPYWSRLLEGEWAHRVAGGSMSVEEMRGWMLQIYPFIHAFPKFLAEALIKVEDDESRAFLIDNIRVEKAHAEHWIWMGTGFGLTREEMLDLAEGNRPVLRDVQSLTDWLWYINTKGTLPEAVAATSFAIEGATGDLSRAVWGGFESYRDHPAVHWNPRTYKWMREHARYDDEHPKIAMTIVERYATTEKIQKRVMLAARRSLQLLEQALDTSFRAYTPSVGVDVERDRRCVDRRCSPAPIGFPDRRLRERRGFAVALVE